jgi:cell wall-associated NlpC family hydrolase
MRRALLTFAAVVLLAPMSVAPAGGDEIAEKKAEAQRIARQLESQGRRISIIAEEYNLARIEADEVAVRLATATAQLEQTTAESAAVRRRLKGQAVDAYVRGGAVPALALLIETRLEEDIAVRTQYVESVTNEIGDTLDELRAKRLELEEQRGALTRSRDASREALAAVESKKDEAAAAAAEQERLLRRVEGELAELVAAEEKRRAEEEARRAQAEFAARRARQEAAAREEASRRAAATTTAPPRSAPTTTTARRVTTTTAPAADDAPTSAPPPSSGAAAAVEEAKRQLGKPYEYGGSGPDTFDCSGLTAWAWRAGGKSLPHSSQAQWSATSRVAMTDIAPGDLLFYGEPIHHVGIYVGDGQMIEAPETGKNVRYASIYRSDLVGAGRVN